MAVAAEYRALFRLSDSLVQAAAPIIYFAFYLLLFILAGGSASARTALATTFHFPSTDPQTLIYVIIVTIIVTRATRSCSEIVGCYRSSRFRERISSAPAPDAASASRGNYLDVSGESTKLKFDVALRVIA